jgi:RimJ/RimL family protein N-acetyltransferase
MVEFATQFEVDNFKDFELRLLTPLDALEFAKANNETYMDLANFFDEEFYSQQRPFMENFNSLMASIRNSEMDIFGFFNGRRLLGVASFHFLDYSKNGCQIVIWMRSSESGKKIGAYFLKRLTLYAIYRKRFRFVELIIDKANGASRAIASKIGYEYIHDIEANTSGKLASGIYCRYFCFDPEIDLIADEYGVRKVDLIDHPGYYKEFRDLITIEEVNFDHEWPYPVYEERTNKINIPVKRRKIKSKYSNSKLSNSSLKLI